MTLSWLDGPLPAVKEIGRRLTEIIPGGQDPRRWARRSMAAKTLFVMLYGYAVEGFDRWIRPTAVTDMTDAQASLQDPATRREWLATVQGHRRPRTIEGRWFSENTREPIRDETLRRLVELGIVVERPSLPTTSPKPRYALAESFTKLLSPELRGTALTLAIDKWQKDYLSAAALGRLVLERKGAGAVTRRPALSTHRPSSPIPAPDPPGTKTAAAMPAFVACGRGQRRPTSTGSTHIHAKEHHLEAGKDLPWVPGRCFRPPARASGGPGKVFRAPEMTYLDFKGSQTRPGNDASG